MWSTCECKRTSEPVNKENVYLTTLLNSKTWRDKSVKRLVEQDEGSRGCSFLDPWTCLWRQGGQKGTFSGDHHSIWSHPGYSREDEPKHSVFLLQEHTLCQATNWRSPISGENISDHTKDFSSNFERSHQSLLIHGQASLRPEQMDHLAFKYRLLSKRVLLDPKTACGSASLPEMFPWLPTTRFGNL